jgi:hypothetical protein
MRAVLGPAVHNPMFSIVVVHYQGVNPHDICLRGLASIEAQTFRDFEVLCYHDGPLLDPEVRFPQPLICTARRYNDWGHSLRDLGIRQARGEYIVHFNADNILYPNALEEIAKEIQRHPRLHDQARSPIDTNDIVIFPIRMWNLIKFRDLTLQLKGQPSFYVTLNGIPPVVKNIDCMQLVMKRTLWLQEGGWYDRSELGDGYMYQHFARKYGYRNVGPVLGEHF